MIDQNVRLLEQKTDGNELLEHAVDQEGLRSQIHWYIDKHGLRDFLDLMQEIDGEIEDNMS